MATNVSFGKYNQVKLEEFENCDLNPPPIGRGMCNYYENRFKNFMDRHKECTHNPPVYYYGELREPGTIPQSTKIRVRIMNYSKRVLTFGQSGAEDAIKKLESERKKLDASLPQYTRNGETLVPTPDGSYGYKYCTKFTDELLPKLSDFGKAWLKKTKQDLQVYMEKGVVDKNYVSVYNKKFNVKNGLTRKDGVTRVTPASKIKDYYTNIELSNGKFQSFAFATHPDAYNPMTFSQLPPQDLIRVILTPDMKEWMGAETWEQAWVMAKNLDYSELAGTAWEEVKSETKERVDSAGDSLKRYWNEIFD